MSCVVGIVSNGRVSLAGDSAATNEAFQIATGHQTKVFRFDEFVIGSTGSLRILQVLHYAFTPPPLPHDGVLMRYMVCDFVEALKICLKADGQKEENLLADSCLMVGIHGHLFVIYSDFQVEESRAGYNAIGSADNIALGSLHATRDRLKGYASLQLHMALEAAQEHNASVRAPFEYVVTPEEDK